ncbi:hypothetical protein L7G72_20110 [Xenorhabdus bovienii]|uniref:hypothetical protein n=1 Tax=Xenorhabdus bovienii TaxID=40576 RepID=UPI001EE092AD|nr:hypothetical protein [Xenorhabdus bovienii]MCG3464062.1 hypothetical protein [Xenorhabdus bovienii]
MLSLGDIHYCIFWFGITCWAFWYISIPIVAISIFMASRKKTGRAGKITYSICVLLFLLPMLLGPFIMGDALFSID